MARLITGGRRVVLSNHNIYLMFDDQLGKILVDSSGHVTSEVYGEHQYGRLTDFSDNYYLAAAPANYPVVFADFSGVSTLYTTTDEGNTYTNQWDSSGYAHSDIVTQRFYSRLLQRDLSDSNVMWTIGATWWYTSHPDTYTWYYVGNIYVLGSTDGGLTWTAYSFSIPQYITQTSGHQTTTPTEYGSPAYLQVAPAHDGKSCYVCWHSMNFLAASGGYYTSVDDKLTVMRVYNDGTATATNDYVVYSTNSDDIRYGYYNPSRMAVPYGSPDTVVIVDENYHSATSACYIYRIDWTTGTKTSILYPPADDGRNLMYCTKDLHATRTGALLLVDSWAAAGNDWFRIYRTEDAFATYDKITLDAEWYIQNDVWMPVAVCSDGFLVIPFESYKSPRTYAMSMVYSKDDGVSWQTGDDFGDPAVIWYHRDTDAV